MLQTEKSEKMATVSELSGVKLRKTSKQEDNFVEKDVGQRIVLCENDEQYKKLMEDTYIEKYFNSIEKFTFPTEFIPLSKELAKEITDLHMKDAKQRGTRSKQMTLVENAIDQIIYKRKWDLIFIRLSSRSPKDALQNNSNLKQLFQKELKFIEEEEKQFQVADYQFSSVNRKLHALYR